MDRIDVVIGIVLRHDCVLICKRRPAGPLGGYWEFPGGKREAGETPEQCLARELWEELVIRVRPTAALAPIEHDYPTARIRLYPFLCEHLNGEPQPVACERVKWVAPGDLRDYPFPPANAALIGEIIGRLSSAAPTVETKLTPPPPYCGGRG